MDGVYDSNIVIDANNGYREALELLTRSVNPAISVITWMEVMAGTQDADEPGVRRFLASFLILPVTDEVMEESVRVRRGSRVKLMDAMILATGVNGRVLVTRNTRHFGSGDAGIWVPYRV